MKAFILMSSLQLRALFWSPGPSNPLLHVSHLLHEVASPPQPPLCLHVASPPSEEFAFILSSAQHLTFQRRVNSQRSSPDVLAQGDCSGTKAAVNQCWRSFSIFNEEVGILFGGSRNKVFGKDVWYGDEQKAANQQLCHDLWSFSLVYRAWLGLSLSAYGSRPQEEHLFCTSVAFWKCNKLFFQKTLNHTSQINGKLTLFPHKVITL